MKTIYLIIISLLLFNCNGQEPESSVNEDDLTIDLTKYELTCGALDTMNGQYIHYDCNGTLIDNPDIKIKGEYIFDMRLDTLIPWEETMFDGKRITRKVQWNIIPDEPYEEGYNPSQNFRIVFDSNGDTIHERSKYSLIQANSTNDTIHLSVKYIDPFIDDPKSSYILQVTSDNDSLFKRTFKSNIFTVDIPRHVFGNDTGILQAYINHNRPVPTDSTRLFQEVHTFKLR